MKAQKFELGSLEIMITCERIANTTAGNPRYELVILSRHEAAFEFAMWSPEISKLFKRTKAGKYRTSSYETPVEIILELFTALKTWFFKDVPSNNTISE